MSVARTAASVPAGSHARRLMDTHWSSAYGTHTSRTARPTCSNTMSQRISNPAKKTIPANDLKEFIAWLRSNPDRVSMATVGAGSPGHLLGFLLEKETGARFGLVAYRGAGPAMQDVVAGQIDAMFSNTATALPQVLSGNVKAFAVTAKHRVAAAPDIPSVDEAGLPGLYFSLWAGLFCPPGTPKKIIYEGHS